MLSTFVKCCDVPRTRTSKNRTTEIKGVFEESQVHLCPVVVSLQNVFDVVTRVHSNQNIQSSLDFIDPLQKLKNNLI